MIDLRRGAVRFHTVTAGIESWHSFSYGPHYDPDNLGFAGLMAHNEDRLDPGAGYDRHAHRGIDIVTWVIGGTLEHAHWVDDFPAHRERLTAGCLQVLRTGGGVEHAERSAGVGHGGDGSRGDGSRGDGSGAHYVQMWLRSGHPDARPEYACRDATADLAEAEGDGSVRLVTVATGRPVAAPDAALVLSAPGVELGVARLPEGAHMDLTEAGSDHVARGPAHLFVSRGALRLGDADAVVDGDGVTLVAGDALRLRGERPTLTALGPAEILLWRFAG